MSTDKPPNGNPKGIVAAIAIVLILFPLGYSIVRSVFAQGPRPFIETPDGSCVRENMRFEHMYLLKEL